MQSQNIVEKREEVYRAIDTERNYQESLARNTTTDQRPLEQVALIEEVIRQAKQDWYNNPGAFDMNYMRKIAGIAVRCMEQHGAIRRPRF